MRSYKNSKQALALDEANENNIHQEKKIHFFKEETNGLKEVLLLSQIKCLKVEEKAKASEQLRQRDDMLLKSEDQNRWVEDQLKLKEQLNYLEEDHENL